ncbi:MAG: hypothetical protein LBV69_09415 [Bacteroidales bacterium]|jgi:hypothetical protein|nr:hypothetical protein [Bacteroidales bacterium]
MKSILKIFLVITVFVTICTGCEKKNEINVGNVPNEEKKIEIKDNQYFSQCLTSALNACKVISIKKTSNNSYELIKSNKSKYVFEIIDSYSFKICFKEESYIVKKDETSLLISNLQTHKDQEYFDISGLTDDLDDILLLSVTAILYFNECPNKEIIDFPSIGNLCYAQWTYWCIYPRRSSCTHEMIVNAATEHCGHAPSKIYGTDCGCIWGDFSCICITDFDC